MMSISEAKKDLLKLYLNMKPSNMVKINHKLSKIMKECFKDNHFAFDWKDLQYDFKTGVKHNFNVAYHGFSDFGREEYLNNLMQSANNNPFKAHALFHNMLMKDAIKTASQNAFWRTTEVIKYLIDNLNYVQKHLGTTKTFGGVTTGKDYSISGLDPYDLHEYLNEGYLIADNDNY